LTAWIKGQVTEAKNHILKIDDGTGVIEVLRDEKASEDVQKTIDTPEIQNKMLEIYGSAQRVEGNRLIFKALKVIMSGNELK
jgi:RNase P/RNase MRP subunit p29